MNELDETDGFGTDIAEGRFSSLEALTHSVLATPVSGVERFRISPCLSGAFVVSFGAPARGRVAGYVASVSVTDDARFSFVSGVTLRCWVTVRFSRSG